MGQENCHCGGMCGPQAPEEEQRHQVTVEPEPPHIQGHQDYAAPRQADTDGTPRNGDDTPHGHSYGQDNGWDDGGYLPPPPPEPIGFAPLPGAPTPAHGGNASGVTIESILEYLEGEEEKAYGDAFEAFAGPGATHADLFNDGLKEFIARNNSLGMDDVEIHLLTKVGDEIELGITKAQFLALLRETAIKQEEVLNQYQFLVTGDGELTSPECRSGLLAFATSKLGTNFSEERWEAVLDHVMKSAGITISMEHWVEFCTNVARICRLVRYLNI